MAESGALVGRADTDLHEAAEERGRLIGLAPLARQLFAVLALRVLLSPAVSRGEDRPSDNEIYRLAVDYCRAPVPRPMALSSDQKILCFDGWIDDGMDLSLARDLREFGFLVVRSLGGHDATAVALAHLLRDRHATVVVYDFCISTCANYLFIASDQTYVVADALVAWPPQSFYVRKTFKNMYELKGVYPNDRIDVLLAFGIGLVGDLRLERCMTSRIQGPTGAARLHLGQVIYDP